MTTSKNPPMVKTPTREEVAAKLAATMTPEQKAAAKARMAALDDPKSWVRQTAAEDNAKYSGIRSKNDPK